MDLELIEPETDDLFKAVDTEGRTSFQDNLCFLTAKRHNLICVTNDTNLRLMCEASNVPILWGLELILMLVREGGLIKKEAAHIAQEIHNTNPKHIDETVLKRFLSKLKSQ